MRPNIWVILTILFTSITAHAGSVSVTATNAPVVLDAVPMAPDIALPPPTVTTNSQGVPVYRFSMSPVVTNMTAATNDLARLEAQLQAVDKKLQSAVSHGKSLRQSIKTDYVSVVGVMTNFVSRNEDAKKIQVRIKALETELKAAQAEMKKLMDADPAFKAAKTKVVSTQQEFESMEKSMQALRAERVKLSAEVWQLRTMVDKTRKEQQAAEAKKAQESKGAR